MSIKRFKFTYVNIDPGSVKIRFISCFFFKTLGLRSGSISGSISSLVWEDGLVRCEGEQLMCHSGN